MTDSARPAAGLPPLADPQRTARIAGWLFVGTFVTSIVGLLLYDPVLNDTGYILGAGSDWQISMGAFLEILLAITNIGTAVVLFPVLKRQSEGLALAWVGSPHPRVDGDRRGV